MKDAPGGPFPKSVRKEDWYLFDEDGFVTCTVNVYPNEIVAIPTVTYDMLASGNIEDNRDEDSDIYLLKYPVVRQLLEDNGFVRL